MGRSTPRSWALPPEAAALPEPEIARSGLDGILDLESCFGRPGPVEVEVGPGKGRFLLEEAAARPGTLFLAIERARPYLRLIRHRVLQRGLANVRLLGGDAVDVFHRLLAPGSAEQVHVLFPDPWPKRRHGRRRVIRPEFVVDVAGVLRPGGLLNVATDHPHYAPAILAAVGAVAELEALGQFALDGDLAERTHFGAKSGGRGLAIHAWSWRRR